MIDGNDFLITGHRKCGTTLLLNLLDFHPEILTYPEDLCIFYGYFPHYTMFQTDIHPKELMDRLDSVIFGMLKRKSNSRGYAHKIDIQKFRGHFWDNFDKNKLNDIAYIYDTLKHAWIAQNEPKNNFLAKETSIELSLSELSSRGFQPNKIIHLIRDPRDNFAAIKAGMPHYKSIGDDLETALLGTIYRIKLGHRLIKSNTDLMGSENYLVVKYEDLVTSSDLVMSKIAKFLNITYDTCLLLPTIIGVPHGGNNHDGDVNFQISSGNAGRWKERITEQEAIKLEFYLSEFMDDFSYKRNYTDSDAARGVSLDYLSFNSKNLYRDSFANVKYI